VSARLSAHEVGLESLDALADVEALCVFLGEDERPLPGSAGFVDWRMCGRLSRLLKEGFFTGAREDCLLLPTEGAIAIPRLFAIGVGQSARLTPQALREVAAFAGRVLKRARVESVALELPAAEQLGEEVRAGALMSDFLPAFGGKRVAVLGPKALTQRLVQERSAGG
jgi:leucyl aminopeptidase